MRVDSNFRDIFLALETFEKGLNVAGYIPVVGSFTAGVRSVYSGLEAISGIALAVLAIGMRIQGNTAHGLYLTIGVTLIGHAILNSIRAGFEKTPFIPLGTTLPYDLLSTYWIGRRFFSYVD